MRRENENRKRVKRVFCPNGTSTAAGVDRHFGVAAGAGFTVGVIGKKILEKIVKKNKGAE